MRIIDADRYQKDLLSAYDDASIELEVLDRQPLVSAIPISEGATNGNIFLKTHPEVVATIIKKEGYLFNCVQLRNKGETIPFAEVYIDWWNAPYKKDVEE